MNSAYFRREYSSWQVGKLISFLDNSLLPFPGTNKEYSAISTIGRLLFVPAVSTQRKIVFELSDVMKLNNSVFVYVACLYSLFGIVYSPKKLTNSTYSLKQDVRYTIMQRIYLGLFWEYTYSHLMIPEIIIRDERRRVSIMRRECSPFLVDEETHGTVAAIFSLVSTKKTFNWSIWFL